MICGYCLSEMTLGTIVTDGQVVKWMEDQLEYNLSPENKSSINFFKNESHDSIRAFYCSKCNKIILDLERVL